MHFQPQNFNTLFEKIPESKLVLYLKELRMYELKVKELGVEKSAFNYMKRLGIFQPFMNSEPNGWQYFNMTERLLIKLSEILWRYGYEVDTIRHINSVLLDDSWLLSKINSLMASAPVSYEHFKQGADSNMTFIEYCLAQKNKLQRIKFFTNLDALIILAIEFRIPISIQINGKGEFHIYSGIESELLKAQDIFHSSFLNIPILEVFNTYIPELKVSSLLFNPNENGIRRIDTLIRKGFDAKTLREVEFSNESLSIEEEDLPLTANLGKAKNEFANQDLIVKVRQSKVVSIKRLKIQKA